MQRRPALGRQEALRALARPAVAGRRIRPDGEPVERLRGRARDYMALCTERHVAVVVAPLRPYPVNALRNRAWAMATTSHVLLLDVDFWPSVGARRRIVGALRALPESGERRALVLPALELTLQRSETKNPAKVLEQAELERQIPSSKLGLLRCVANGAEGGAPLRWQPTRASHWEDPISDPQHRRRRLATQRIGGGARHPGAHRTVIKRVPFRPTMKPTTPAPAISPETLRKRAFLHALPALLENTAHEAEPSNLRCSGFHHHGTTRFMDWLVDADDERRAALDCFLGNHFEPFVVVRRCDEATPRNGSARVPRFDERFTGYGKNKIEWISSLRGADYAFYTVASAFAVHVPHLQSAAKKEWDRSFKKKNATHRAAGARAQGLRRRPLQGAPPGLGLYDKADATVDFLEDLDMRRFAEVAKACVLDAATCAGG
ncbi:hypothetical protein JL722_11022 [Aureococcus anophagefferens]|nr:hypothetical protein JL722_11022 [Aureococcus anophagefferens]